MRRVLLFILILPWYGHAAAAWFDQLQAISDPLERVNRARQIYFTNDAMQNGRSLQAATQELQARARSLKDIRLTALALVMQVNFDIRYNVGEDSVILNNLNKVGAIARQTRDQVLEVDYLHFLGMAQFRFKNFEQAFENLLKANHIIQKNGYCNFPYASIYLYDLGVSYYRFFDPQKTITLLNEAMTCGFPSNMSLLNCYNTLGMAKRQLNNHPAALDYFKKANALAIRLGDSAWYGITAGNMGSVYAQMGQQEQALTLLNIDFKLSVAHKEWNSAVGGCRVIANIYLQQHQLSKANEQIHLLDTIFPKVNDNYIRYCYYGTRAAIEKTAGNFEKAYYYLDSSHYFQQLNLNLNSNVVTKTAEQKMQVENHLADLRLLESEKSRQLVIRNAIIGATFLLLIIAVQLIYRQKQKQRQHLEDIRTARYQLKTYIDNLREKNLLLETFQKEIAHLHATTIYHPSSDSDEIRTKLQQFTILTEDDWKDFKHLFEQVYHDFFHNLNLRYQGLTQSEMRLIALNKLNLSKKEMAEMLGVSLDAIRKTRQRIRYKLSLPDEKSLKELLSSI